MSEMTSSLTCLTLDQGWSNGWGLAIMAQLGSYIWPWFLRLLATFFFCVCAPDVVSRLLSLRKASLCNLSSRWWEFRGSQEIKSKKCQGFWRLNLRTGTESLTLYHRLAQIQEKETLQGCVYWRHGPPKSTDLTYYRSVVWGRQDLLTWDIDINRGCSGLRSAFLHLPHEIHESQISNK